MKHTSGNNHPINGQKRTQKTHCFYEHKTLRVLLPYDALLYIVVFSTTSSTFFMSISSSKHVSLE